ncbi:uncharacterized protein NEMAJ01_2287, partial [Nematocida major]|uniref:uncharacterized protein n=1 Tax=Nematocida major TaxID=1912982 RepID=UPI0020076A3B
MAYESLGSTVRNALLKYSLFEQVSVWDFSQWDALWMTVLSSKRMMFSFFVTTVVIVCSLGFIILRKRSFTQKDTLCAFIFMVVSIFLLETVQNMLKTEISLDATYTDVSISIPFSSFLTNTPQNRQKICSNGLDGKLEQKQDELKFGERASATYRRLLRSNLMMGAPASGASVGPVAQVPAYASQKTEYCIFKTSQRLKNKDCQDCIFLENTEFDEAKADLIYIDGVMKEYQEIERNLEQSRLQYRQYSFDLMKAFKDLNRESYYARGELSTVGVDFGAMESAIIALVSKYDRMFAGVSAKYSRLKVGSNSVCVSIGSAALPVSEPRKNLWVKRQTKTLSIVKKRDAHPGTSLIVSSRAVAQPSVDASIADTLHDMIISNGGMSAVYGPAGTASSSASKDPFFADMRFSLWLTQILIFFQVLLVLGVIISIVFDKNWLYCILYCCMCGSLIASLALGFVAFVNSAALSSLCKSGLQCDSQIAAEQL